MLHRAAVNMGDAFCNFPLHDASVFFFFLAMRMKLHEDAWAGGGAPSFDLERRPLGASLPLQLSDTEGASFPNSQLLLRSNFSYSKHYRHWNA